MNTRLFCRTLPAVLAPLAVAAVGYNLPPQEDRMKHLFQKGVIEPSLLTPKLLQSTSSLPRSKPFFSPQIAHAEASQPPLAAELSAALESVRQNPFNLKNLSPSMRNNETVVLTAVEQDGMALQYASDELRNNEKIVLAAVVQNGLALLFASIPLHNEKIGLAAVKQTVYAVQYASIALRNNEKIILAAVEQNGYALRFASEALQNNEKIVLAAVEQDGMALEYASKALRNNEKIVLAAVKQNGLALKYASKALRNNEKIVLAAVKQNGLALKYASNELRNRREIALAAVRQDADAYEFVGETLRNDPEILRIVRGVEFTPPFSIDFIRSGIAMIQSSPNATIGLFSSNQTYKDGAVNTKQAQKILHELRNGAKEGIHFTDLESTALSGGTCSAMTLTFAHELSPLKKVTMLKDFLAALERISNKRDVQGCVTESCESLRDLQIAFNAIRISPSHRQFNLDFSKLKVESLAQVYDFSVGVTSKAIEIRSSQAQADLKKEIDNLPKGIYLLRALNKADNEKLENFGHSLLFFSGDDFIGLYDPSVGMKIASLQHTEGFISDTVLFSLRRYALHEARFYELT